MKRTTGIECETPQSPPGDYNRAPPLPSRTAPACRVKHLNPRQGITTGLTQESLHSSPFFDGVKHLNPRQGITTPKGTDILIEQALAKCETPKSPPGDYNGHLRRIR